MNSNLNVYKDSRKASHLKKVEFPKAREKHYVALHVSLISFSALKKPKLKLGEDVFWESFMKKNEIEF